MNYRPPNQRELLQGQQGERRHLEFLCRWRDVGAGDFCRPDFLWVPSHGWFPYLIEVKTQHAFQPPPFAGHGLPVRQFNVLMAVWKAISLPTQLVVYDPGAQRRYSAFLNDLAQGPSFTTNGEKPRIVFPLESFIGYRP